MQFYLVYFAWLVVSAKSSMFGEKRRCPACIDHSYIQYIEDHPYLYHEEYRLMAIPYDVDDFRCNENNLTKVSCYDACIRVQLRDSIKKDDHHTVGWMFYCSTNVITKTPNWLHLPSNLDRYDDDFIYVDQLSRSLSYEVTFYGHADRVETPYEFQLRMSGWNRQLFYISKQISKIKGMYFLVFLLAIGLVVSLLGILIQICFNRCKKCCEKSTKKDMFESHELMEGQFSNKREEENLPSTSTQTSCAITVV